MVVIVGHSNTVPALIEALTARQGARAKMPHVMDSRGH